MQFKDWNEAVASNRPFYQLMYYDRRKEYIGYLQSMYFSTKKELEVAIRKMEKCNNELFEKMLEVYKPYGVTKKNYRDYDIWNRLVNSADIDKLSKGEKYLFRYDKERVGFCHIRWYRRDLKQERKEEENAQQSNESHSKGPYGGAFRDWEDYYRWKER